MVNRAHGAERALGGILRFLRSDWSLRWLDICSCTDASEKCFAFAVREGCRVLASEVGRVSERPRFRKSSSDGRWRLHSLGLEDAWSHFGHGLGFTAKDAEVAVSVWKKRMLSSSWSCIRDGIVHLYASGSRMRLCHGNCSWFCWQIVSISSMGRDQRFGCRGFPLLDTAVPPWATMLRGKERTSAVDASSSHGNQTSSKETSGGSGGGASFFHGSFPG